MATRKQLYRGQPCADCGSKRYYDEDGYTYCSNGDRQEVVAGLATQVEVEQLGRHAASVRVRKEGVEKQSRVYRGHAAVILYLETYQHILWQQCDSLVGTIGFPQNFAMVVKELWSLRLHCLREKLVDQQPNPAIIFSSQPADADDEAHLPKSRLKSDALPTLKETLALLYLAAILLRLPVTIGHFHRWAICEDVPYVRVLRRILIPMRQRLPSALTLMLDSGHLNVERLRESTVALMDLYHVEFALQPPKLNVPLIRHAFIRELALPISIHRFVENLTAAMKVNFAFLPTARRSHLCHQPDMALASVLIIATKLHYPFESRETSDCLPFDWERWKDCWSEHEAIMHPPDRLTQGTEGFIGQDDVPDMTDLQIDDYLDWYDRTLIEEEWNEAQARTLPKELLNMFPVPRAAPRKLSYKERKEQEQASLDARLKETLHSLRGADAIRSGSCYRRYRTALELPPSAHLFHRLLAELVGCGLDSLLTCILQLERRILPRYENFKSRPSSSESSSSTTTSQNHDSSSQASMSDVRDESSSQASSSDAE